MAWNPTCFEMELIELKTGGDTGEGILLAGATFDPDRNWNTWSYYGQRISPVAAHRSLSN